MSSLKGVGIKARREKRYSHVYITLRIKCTNKWQGIRALDWNKDGFNFYFPYKIEDSVVLFKKDLREFSGTIVWVIRHDEDNVILEIMLNNLLFEQLKKLSKKKAALRRVFRMLRTEGLLEEKQKMLAHLGLKMSSEKTELLIDKYKKNMQCTATV